MNLRISDKQLRFRITREEFAELLQGNTVEMPLPFSAVTHCCIRPEPTEIPLTLREEGTNLSLIASHKALEDFSRQLPSREGIEHDNLLLEVDVRKSRK